MRRIIVRSYFIDELYPQQIEKLKNYLDQNDYKRPIENIYWFELPFSLLNNEQISHFDKCGPYIISLETSSSWIKLELLVRAQNSFRCSCLSYTNFEQRSYIIEHVDNILKKLDIL